MFVGASSASPCTSLGLTAMTWPASESPRWTCIWSVPFARMGTGRARRPAPTPCPPGPGPRRSCEGRARRPAPTPGPCLAMGGLPRPHAPGPRLRPLAGVHGDLYPVWPHIQCCKPSLACSPASTMLSDVASLKQSLAWGRTHHENACRKAAINKATQNKMLCNWAPHTL